MSDDLVTSLRSAGDPLHLRAARKLTALRARIQQLESVARLNADTIRSMQRAAAEAAAEHFIHHHDNGDFHASRQPRSPSETG